MIQINCNIIKDLLPLYADGIASEDTAELVCEHLKCCTNCRKDLEQMKAAIAMPIDNETQPIKSFKKKWNRKKAVIAISASVITAVLLIGSFVLYSYLTPVIKFAVSTPADTDTESYAQMVSVGYSTKLGLHLPSKTQKNLEEFGLANSAAIVELRENYKKPMRIEASIKVVNDQTIVTYTGTVTDGSGRNVPYEKILTFDFVLTEEMPQ